MSATQGVLVVTIEKTNTGFSAFSDQERGIYSVGSNINELRENIQEVIEEQVGYLEEIGEQSRADELKSAIVEYKLDMEQFFEHYSMINKTEFAKYVGINPSLLRQYSKGLVSVSDERVLQIQNGIHKLAKDFKSVKFA